MAEFFEEYQVLFAALALVGLVLLVVFSSRKPS